jgi:hypothetical protein
MTDCLGVDMTDATSIEDTERWLTIPGFPDYEVSDLGNIRSWKWGRPKAIKASPMGIGYMHFAPFEGGARHLRLVHLVVLLAFVGPRPQGMHGCHWDGDLTNNALRNLRYGTPTENEADKRRQGRNPFLNKTQCGRGHEYSPENTRYTKRGHRECRTCLRAREQARTALRRASNAYQYKDSTI